jgi:hypothetical protein
LEIRINGEKIDFTLEQEHVLGEVIDGLQEWLETNGFTIAEIRRDDTNVPLGSKLDWKDDPVQDISVLEIIAHHPMDLAFDKLSAVARFLELIQENADPESAFIRDLMKGAEDVGEMIDAVLPIPGSERLSFGSQFLQLASESGISSEGPIRQDAFSALLKFISELLLVLSSRIREISDPETELKATMSILDTMLGNIGDVAILLQTGKDVEAMMKLAKFIETVQRMIRVLHYLGEKSHVDLGLLNIEGASTKEFTLSLNDFLRELMSAMETGDTVLIGDLLEYEVAPKLGAFHTALRAHGIL